MSQPMQPENTHAGANQHLMACEACGLVVSIPSLSEAREAHCPRCEHLLTQTISMPYQRPVAYGLACLVMMLLSLCFPFMSFSVQGMAQHITLLDAVYIMEQYHNAILAVLLLSTIILLPALYLSMLLLLYCRVALSRNPIAAKVQPNWLRIVCRILFAVEPWLMVDVFLIGVLVSLVKIATLADIDMGTSFWAFCAYTCLLVKCIALVDRKWLWECLFPAQAPLGVTAGDTHQTGNHISCQLCHQIHAVTPEQAGRGSADLRCSRCYSRLHGVNGHLNLQRVWALLLAAIAFYFPANVYPIMVTVSLGNPEPATIMGGVLLLWQHGSYLIAFIIFTASIFIPIAKMVALVWLFYEASQQRQLPSAMRVTRLKIYRLTEFIGRWSMIDVFVVALLVALVQLQGLMEVYPGPAALSFAAVVIFTMLAARVFDSRLLWSETPAPVRAAGQNGEVGYNRPQVPN